MKLEVKNIHKCFGETEVLHGVSFSVENGKALGLLGRNGAGKTTTIRIIMDVFRADAGEILIDGEPFKPRSYQIGYLPEERGLYPKQGVLEQMVYFARLRGLSARQARENGKNWLERLGIGEYAGRRLETLSKGNQQKVQLAQTLICDPQIAILDEPFSGLDPVNSQLLEDAIKDLISRDRLVIFSSHQMSYVEEFCEDIAIINHGDIVLSGKLKEIKQQFGANRLLLGVRSESSETLRTKVEDQLNELVSVTGAMQECLILELKHGTSKAELMAKMAGLQWDVSRFGDYEPSLNDIFVQKAGDAS